jgi:hypothetical protein
MRPRFKVVTLSTARQAGDQKHTNGTDEAASVPLAPMNGVTACSRESR